jgi:hypothetical protein
MIDDILGRRYTLTRGAFPLDFTIVAFDGADRLTVHDSNRCRQHMSLATFRRCLQSGAIEESAGAPFTWSDPHEIKSLLGC